MPADFPFSWMLSCFGLAVAIHHGFQIMNIDAGILTDVIPSPPTKILPGNRIARIRSASSAIGFTFRRAPMASRSFTLLAIR